MCATVYMEKAASMFHKCEYVDASMDNQLVAFPIYARMLANRHRRRNSKTKQKKERKKIKERKKERQKDEQNQLPMQRWGHQIILFVSLSRSMWAINQQTETNWIWIIQDLKCTFSILTSNFCQSALFRLHRIVIVCAIADVFHFCGLSRTAASHFLYSLCLSLQAPALKPMNMVGGCIDILVAWTHTPRHHEA